MSVARKKRHFRALIYLFTMFAPAENLISLEKCVAVTFEPHLVKFQGEVAQSGAAGLLEDPAWQREALTVACGDTAFIPLKRPIWTVLYQGLCVCSRLYGYRPKPAAHLRTIGRALFVVTTQVSA